MRPRFTLVCVLIVLGGCDNTVPSRPPPLPCPDSGCGGPVRGTSGGIVGTPTVVPPPDAGGLDAPGPSTGFAQVTGTVTSLSSFPIPSANPRAVEHPAVGWTVEVVGHSDIADLTDSAGGFRLARVPTQSLSGSSGAYYGLIARPTGGDFGSYQSFSVGGASNIFNVSSTVLQNAINGSATVDVTQSVIVVSVVNSLATGGLPVQQVTVRPVTDLAVVTYDTPGGVLIPSELGTGLKGIAVVVNVDPGAGPTASRTVGLQATHNRVTQTFSADIFAGVVTWATLLVTD